MEKNASAASRENPVLSFFPPLFSKDTNSCKEDKDQEIVQFLQAGFAFNEFINRVQETLQVKNGLVSLNEDRLRSIRISQFDIVPLSNNVHSLNRLALTGQIKIANNLAITGLTPLFLAITIIDTTIGTMQFKLEMEFKWYGARFYINKALLQKIRELIIAGAGVAGVAAALQAAGIITAPSALVTGLIAALLGLGAAALALADFCNGIYVVLPYSPLPVPIVYPA